MSNPARFAASFVAFVAAAFNLNACSLYHSTDRDYFDSNAKAGAPAGVVQTKPTLLRTDCSKTTLQLEETGQPFDWYEILRNELTATIHYKHGDVECRISFKEPATDSALISAAKAEVENWSQQH